MEEDLKNLKGFIELCKDEIEQNNENTSAVFSIKDLKSLNNLINEYEDILQENTKIKSLLNAQSRIAKILAIPSNEEMVKFREGFYIPISMTFSKEIDQDEILQLKYVNVTSLLKYRIDKEGGDKYEKE